MRMIFKAVCCFVAATAIAACDDGTPSVTPPVAQDAGAHSDTTGNGDGAAAPDATAAPDGTSSETVTSQPDAVGTPDTPQPPDDSGPAPDVATPPPTGGAIGDACGSASDCGGGAQAACLDLPGGYCALEGCSSGTCPAGSGCFEFTSGTSYCIKTCAADNECRTTDGYICDADATCWPGDPSPPIPNGGSPIGGPCLYSDDCADVDAGASCYFEANEHGGSGFVGGYCMLWNCQPGGCPAGAKCISVTSNGTMACMADCSNAACPQDKGYTCSAQTQTCWPGCSAHSDCPSGYGCNADLGMCQKGFTDSPFACDDQTFEPNPTIAQPATLAVPSQTQDVDLCAGEEDWYQVTIPAGHIGTVGADFWHVNGDLDLIAYDENGEFLGSRVWYETYPESWRGHETGDEFLSIYSANAPVNGFFRVRGHENAQNSYDLSVTTTEWTDGLMCTDFYGFDECRGFDGTPSGTMVQFPFPRADDPFVPGGYTFDSYGGYRWLRRETIMVVRYAIHETQKQFPGTGPLGLIDMADRHGITPGFDVGDPRHPASTHDQGGNIDIAYYQSDGDSSAESVCGPNNSDNDQYFCTSTANHIMDVPRTAYFIAMLARHPRLRVIGVDKLLAPLIIAELNAQAAAGTLTQTEANAAQSSLAYGDGWPFHHHHMHLSMRWWSQDGSPTGLVLPLPDPPVGCGFRL